MRKAGARNAKSGFLSRVFYAASSHLKTRWFLFFSCFVAVYALAFLAVDTFSGVREILISTEFGPTGRMVEPFETAHGEKTRNLVITSAPDGRWWIMHAERMAREGSLRIRKTKSDNPPNGREVHWSSLQMWNLIGISKFLDLFPFPPNLSPIEWAAFFVGPLTWSFFFLLGLIFTWKAFGKSTALAWVLCMLSARSVLYYFRVGEADHHGLVAMFAALGVLLLVGGRLGLSTTPNDPRSKGWFCAAGFFSALGLWVSAATQLPILFASGLGGILAIGLASRSPSIRWNPTVWRIWGVTGAITSLLLYLVEYFPDKMGWRLEVNHPFYSLAWLAAGELMCQISLAFAEWNLSRFKGQNGLKTVLCIAAILLPIILIVAGGERFFVVSDRFLYDLHDFFINEFMSLAAVAKSTGFEYAIYSYSFTLATILIVGISLVGLRLPVESRAVLLFASLPALVMTLLAIRQIRWSGTASAMLIPLVLTSLWCLAQTRPARWRLILVWVILAASTLPTTASLAFRTFDMFEKGNSVDQSIVPSVITRDICQRISASMPGKQPVVLASPSTSTEIIYYGGAKAIGTLYWENLEGLRKAAEIYSLKDENEALRRIQELGVTHILLFSWDSFGQRYVRLQRGLGKDDEARDGFIPALLEGTRPQPTWLTPLYYPIPKEYKLGDDQWVRIYSVAPGQSKADWFHGIAIYQLDAGKEDLAERSLREALALEPGKVDSRIALLLLLATQQRPAELAAEVQSALKNMGVNGHNLIQQAALDLAKSNQNSAADALLKALSDNDKF